jgi:acyl-CoA synthetase (AMP-forming)/AMP-acid ligase II
MFTINDLVRYWGRNRPSQEALVFNDTRLTWSELDSLSDALARGLIARGVGVGDRVGFLMKNRVELVALMLATIKTGAICVPLNFRLVGKELAALVQDAAPRLIVADDDLTALLEPAQALAEFDLYAIDSADHPRYDSLIVEAGPRPIIDIHPHAPAFICYTSGTTGMQKGAVLSHANILSVGQAATVAHGLTGRDRVLAAAPLVYTGGCISVFMMLVVYPGSTMVLLDHFDAELGLDALERHAISAATMVPVIWERMSTLPRFDTARFAEFHFAGAGGAPVSLELLETYRSRGLPLTQVYGLTEASGLVSTMGYEDAIRNPGYAGLPLVGTEIRVGEVDRWAAPDEVGEIMVKGPHVMKGYWKAPEASARAVSGGWLRTGDLGLQNAEGILKLVDRSKDMLISGGLNVYPAEIEKELAGIDGVLDLAVIGVPDPQWGEVPMVVLYTERSSETILPMISAACTENLARFKQPKHLVLADAPLPRTFSGKLAKAALRQEFPTVPNTALPINR